MCKLDVWSDSMTALCRTVGKLHNFSKLNTMSTSMTIGIENSSGVAYKHSQILIFMQLCVGPF